MKKTTQLFIVLILLISIHHELQAGKKRNYSVSEISPQLLIKANSVMRYYKETVERTSLKSSITKTVYAVTVLNAAGKDAGYFIQPYFKYSHVGNITATIFDKNGKKIKKVAGEDIMDIATDLTTSLYSDSRAKLIIPEYYDYPFTMEYSFAITNKSSLNIDSWQVYPRTNMSIESEDFFMITPDDNPELGVYYYMNDSTLNLDIQHIDGETIYHLHVENLPPVRSEEFSENLSDCTPVVHFAPVSFSIAGFKGSNKSWIDYGNFICDLNEGRAILPEQTVNIVKAIAESFNDEHKVVDSLYKYMQAKVRYVSVQKGLGGWQPFEAKMVDEYSYGDCKALTNYMKSLLLAANIDAKYTLVKAGQNASKVVADFPSNQFNHAILCVPLNGDTVWLECTNQHIPSGYLGSFTDDRNVLVVEKDNSKLVRTPALDKSVNARIRIVETTLTSDGDCIINLKAYNRGVFYDRNYHLFSETRTNQKKALLEQLYFSTINLKDFSFSEKFDPVLQINVNISLAVPHYATHSGNRLFFTPYLFSKETSYKLKHQERKTPIIIRRKKSFTDTIVFHLPKGYVTGKLPPVKECSSKFGTYTAVFMKEKNKLTYIRHLVTSKGVFPVSDYSEFVGFYDKIRKYDQTKVVLMNVSQ